MSKAKQTMINEFWAKDQDMPKVFMPRRKHPCPKCKRLRLKTTGSQAVAVKSRTADEVFFRCKSCNHKWGLPREVWLFPRNVKCKECGKSTTLTSTKGNVQYRKCSKCDNKQQQIGKK